jgi:hypothetical protein
MHAVVRNYSGKGTKAQNSACSTQPYLPIEKQRQQGYSL